MVVLGSLWPEALEPFEHHTRPRSGASRMSGGGYGWADSCYLRPPFTSASRLSRNRRSGSFATSERAVGLGGFLEAAELLEEVRTGRGEEMVRGEGTALLQAVQESQALFRSVGLRDSDGPVQLDDGRRIQAQEDVVERRDLAPVGLFGAACLRVERGDCDLHGVGSGSRFAQRLFGESRAL